MIIQYPASGFPGRVDHALFLAGLCVYTLGQVLINAQFSTRFADLPIDLSHWALILGVVLLLPFAGALPWRNVFLLAKPLLMAGIAFAVGMCVLDFVFWSLPGYGEMEAQLATHLINTPVIWEPFMRWGSNEVFNAGLALPSLAYFRASRTGTALVLIGTLVIAIGTQWFNVIGYGVLTLGYVLNFRGAFRAPVDASPALAMPDRRD